MSKYFLVLMIKKYAPMQKGAHLVRTFGCVLFLTSNFPSLVIHLSALKVRTISKAIKIQSVFS